MSKLILYNYFRSSTSYRARIALHFKNLDFEYRPVHLLQDGGHQHKSEYRQLNPIGEVPTLVHGEKVIAQSFAIIEYIDEVFPEQPLMPKDPFLKARVRQFCENINCSAHPYQNLKTLQFLEKMFAMTAEQKAGWIHHWSQIIFSATEKLLENHSGSFCFGDQITAADLFLIPQVFSAERFNVDLNPYPLIQKVNNNALKLESFQRAHPRNQIDFTP